MSGLLFIRHAETDMAGAFCGHSDPPINCCGRAQVAAMIPRLIPETFNAIYSSDLRRATDTADLLAETFLIRVTLTPRLREIYFGEWEGLTWAEIERRDADYARRWTDAFPGLPAPGGEAYEGFERRVLDEVRKLMQIAEGKRIAVVTHGGVMRVVLQTLLGYSEEQSWELTKSYCSYFTLGGDAASRVEPVIDMASTCRELAG